jgi:hypothetical protein
MLTLHKVITAEAKFKTAVFWDVMLYSLVMVTTIKRNILPPSSWQKYTKMCVKWNLY